MSKSIYKESKVIADKLRENILKGISVYKTYDSLRHTQDCPSSHATFYKVYDKVIADARLELDAKLTDAYWKKVDEGDSKLIEFGLRSKAGWNPATKVEDVTDQVDEDTDPLDKLKAMLEKRNESDSS